MFRGILFPRRRCGVDDLETEKKKEKNEGAASTRRERRAGYSVFVRDSIIGFADGLTVPFALTAGLSALGSAKIVVVGGLAELFAGAISMGLGAYLAAVTERKRYEVEERRQRKETAERAAAEEEEQIHALFEQYGISRSASKGIADGLRVDGEMWVRFMMDFDLKLEKASTGMAWIEGLVMGFSYFLGGLLPMIPYFAFSHHVNHALFTSVAITGVILVIFGYVKAMVTGTTHGDAAWSAVQTLFVGALAAAVSYGIVKGVKSTLHGTSCS